MGVSTEPRLLTSSEAAELLRTTTYNVVQQCRAGRIRAVKPFGRWLIPADAIEELLSQTTSANSGGDVS